MRNLITRHKIFFGAILSLMLLTIPLTVWQTQQQQELRQRADSHKPTIGIRLCQTGAPITSINQCGDSEDKGPSSTNTAIGIVAVNNSSQPVDISAFDLELSYDTRYIKTISYQKRNNSPSYPYTVILPDKDITYVKSELKSQYPPNSLETTGTLKIVGLDTTPKQQNKQKIPPNGVIMLAFISAEPSGFLQTGINITDNTKIAVNETTDNIDNDVYDAMLPGTNNAVPSGAPYAFTFTFVPNAPTATPVPTSVPGAPPTATPTPIPSQTTKAVINGKFVDQNDNLLTIPGQKIYMKSGNSNLVSTNASPKWTLDFFATPSNDLKFTVDTIVGYTISHSSCNNCTSHPIFTNGNIFTTAIKAGDILDIVIKYTPLSISPTATPVPTNTPIPTSTPIPAAGDTIIQFQGLSLNSIFTDKDGILISRKPRKLTVYLYKSSKNTSSDLKGNNSDHKKEAELSFNNGLFSVPSINFGKVTPDTYNILIKSSKYLRKLAATQTISSTGGTIIIPSGITLADGVGDIIQDNVLNIDDYEAIRSCFGGKKSTSSCQYKEAADLNDDDKVNELDYNFFLKSLSLTAREGD